MSHHSALTFTTVLALLVAGCSEDRVTQPSPSSTPGSVGLSVTQGQLTGTECPGSGFAFGANVTVDGCPEALNGFTDEHVSWQYETVPQVFGDPGDKEVWATVEHRWSPAGYGVRLVDVKEWNRTPTELTTGVFGVRYIEELTETVIVGYTAWCAASNYSSPEACWLLRKGAHFEVQICAPDGGRGNCLVDPVPNYEGGGSLNLYPLAGRIAAKKLSTSSVPGCSDYQLTASASDDGNDPLSYTWSTSPASSGGSTGAQVVRTFCQGGAHSLRVLVEDAQGGMDLATRDLDVQLPQPASIAITEFAVPQPAAPNTNCIHRVEVSGGVTPYSYSWTINGSVYTGNTSDTFALAYANVGADYIVGVQVMDATGATVTRSAGVTIGGGTGSCPNPTPI